MSQPPLRVLVVGQTPPPHHGQAIMIARLLELRSEHLRIDHVRLAYSDDIGSVGKFAPRKVWILFTTILRVWWMRLRHGSQVLYYPPSGPAKVPVLRDIVFLLATRWLFPKVAFHFHAGGVSGYEARLPALFRPLFRWAYRKPDLAIRTAPQNPDDGLIFGAVRNVVVPNGVEDMRGSVPERTATAGAPLHILFTGVMTEGKGVGVALEAFRLALAEGLDAHLEMMGKWSSEAYREQCEAYVHQHGLGTRVRFIGVLSGPEKFARFAACDIFCFPSFYEAETFGLVLLEAMQFAKPVVSTVWRGIPSVVSDGHNGYLVSIQDPRAVADRLLRLRDAELRRTMGLEGRRIFEREFTLNAFHRNMERELLSLRPG
ncbi:MAG: glycosyltransferase family 4 protein, partial [Flavobacteriales bacterium]